MLEELIEIYEKINGDSIPEFPSALSNLGVVHANLGNFTDAKRYLDRALNVSIKTLGESHSSTMLIRENISNLEWMILQKTLHYPIERENEKE
ncbi:tetratricopeptide repeat protein [Tumebacillus flagellatus]|uniref:tetratricopeptide repeat protein n=1 Tax=Tumebacillus flagellatus TaxID=1157490 RepID=UPI001376EBED|nr:tetratricopeptide repeat protein [Tumebacillus flagellatus]